MRRATCTVVVIRPAIALFLPTLSMRRATGVQVQDVRAEPRISTHALHAESDQRKNACSCVYWNFYPRSPCGERRRLRTSPLKEAIISTHALHAESDLLPSGAEDDYKNFYPRSPCGERRDALGITANIPIDFYPRSPCGERRHHCTAAKRRCTNFYPRSPCGERRTL